MDWLRRPALFPGRLTPAGGGAESSLSVLALARRAWTERQQDGHQALLWATQVLEALPGLALAGTEGVQLQGRMTLVLAEVHLQHLRLDDAEQAAAQARALFAAVDDACGLADVCWLHHMLAADRGDTQALRQSLQEALRHAEQAAEPERQLYFRIVMARSDMLQDAEQARQAWAGRLPESAEGLSPMCAAALADYLGVREGLLSHFAASANWFEFGFEQALASGQLRRAMALASNLGFTFTAASDYARAIDWLQRGLALARKAGWPGSIGLCLAQTGEAMRRVGQVAAARELLQECLDTLDGHPVSRTILLALSYLGQVELDSDHAPQALAMFETLVSRALQVGSTDLRLDGELGRARSLHRLHRLDDARGVAQAALGLAQQLQQQTMRVELLWLLTAIARSAGATSAVVLEGLCEAVALAGAIEGYRAPPGLLEEAAEALAAAGRHEEAYAHARRAALVRRDSLSDEAAKRAAALHLHQQIEAMSAEREHLRRLAEAESARAQVLEDAHQVLTHLSRIGQEITAELVAERVFEVLERHVHAMLPVSCMAIYLLDETRTQLVCAFGVEEGQAFVDPPVPVDEVHSYCARCVRERRGFVLGIDERPHEESQVPGTSEMHSVMFSPLMISERVVGVMTVQTPKVAAYGHREELIFASLCAYAAIALDNARAYSDLGDAQKQLAAQEKLAALGALVAGVAHELNTPIGNSLLMAGTLLNKTDEIESSMVANTLRRSSLVRYFDEARQAAQLIHRGLQTAAGLVASFKQVAVDRTSEQRRVFDLAQTVTDIVATMMGVVRKAGHRVEIDIPPGLEIDGYPGPLGQVLSNFINNALLHAFEGSSREGLMTVRARATDPGWIELAFADDGVGIPADLLHRVFEPFFTTKLGRGGTGLGLSISYNIVEQLFGGHLRVHSSPGHGTCFTLDLPRQAPQREQEGEAPLHRAAEGPATGQ